MARLTDAIRDAYEAFAADHEALWDHVDDATVFHISGDHPLSGTYVGVAEIRRYLTMVREATGGRGGFSVTSVLPGEAGPCDQVVLVEGTAFHGEGPFVRTVVHRLRLRHGTLVELRDHPFDQQTEDRFWSARVPAQRSGGTAAAVIPPQATGTDLSRG